MEEYQEFTVEDLIDSPVGKWLEKAIDTIMKTQRVLFAAAESEDSSRLNLLKIGTVLQIFLIDTLITRKKPENLTKEDWENIADKVAEYAVLEEGQRYSEFVFKLYANYIDLSAEQLKLLYLVPKDKTEALKALSAELRHNDELFRAEVITEVEYIEKNLWTAMEAMVKCMALSFTLLVGPEYAELAESVSMLGFEYGRYVLYAKEQAILNAYIENQYALDEKLQQEYEEYLKEVRRNAERFRCLVDEAFSPGMRESLMQSVELAKEAGVKEEELLKSLDEIDDYFL